MTFEETRDLLKGCGLRTLLLRREEAPGRVLIAPDLSARIMAVSMGGERAENFGFVNPGAVAAIGKHPQFNAYGGALRWWVGPEGGQYGMAFPAGRDRYDLSSWHISEEYNGKPFTVVYPQRGSGASAFLGAEFSVANAAGTRFHIGVTSRISLLAEPPLQQIAGEVRHGNLKHLGYLSETSFENLSGESMKRGTGLVSIWMLGMYAAGPRTYVLAPFERRAAVKIVTDTYFSPAGISKDRLMIKEKEGYLIFRADARQRSKIGLSRARASTTLGSIDLSRNLLTVWRFPVRRKKPYVNSLWEYQRRPYSGDVSNSYNDDGNLGNFYELECSSHALALGPCERFTYPLEIHHFTGPVDALFRAADRSLGRKVSSAFRPGQDPF